MLYIKYLSIIVKSQMQHRISFFLSAAGQFVTSFSAFLGIYFLMNRFGAVGGFSYAEVLLCFAVTLFAFSIAECFARGFDGFAAMLANGEFDRIMVRPRSPIFQVLASRLELTRIGRLFQAALVFAYALPKSGIAWTAERIAVLCLMALCGAALFSALFLVYAGLCFFSTEGLEFINIFTDGGREFGRYPMSVYGRGALRFFTWAVPLALFQYYPLLYLTGRSALPLHALSPLGCLLFFAPAALVWRAGTRHYRSTGS